MRRRIFISLLTALLLVFGALPALAGDDVEEAAEIEEVEEDKTVNEAKLLILLAEFGTYDWSDPFWDDAAGDWDTEFTDGLAATALGNGELFKVMVLLFMGEYPDLETLIADLCDPDTGESDFGWGDFKHGLTGADLDMFLTLPKNLGMIVSAEMRGHGRPDHAVGPDGDPPGKDKAGATGPPAHANKKP
jgi:hypothetical protein